MSQSETGWLSGLFVIEQSPPFWPKILAPKFGKVTGALRNPVKPEGQDLVAFDQILQQLLQLCPFTVAASAYVLIYPHRLVMEIVFDGALLHLEGYTLFALFLGANSTISPVHIAASFLDGGSGNKIWRAYLTQAAKGATLWRAIVGKVGVVKRLSGE